MFTSLGKDHLTHLLGTLVVEWFDEVSDKREETPKPHDTALDDCKNINILK